HGEELVLRTLELRGQQRFAIHRRGKLLRPCCLVEASRFGRQVPLIPGKWRISISLVFPFALEARHQTELDDSAFEYGTGFREARRQRNYCTRRVNRQTSRRRRESRGIQTADCYRAIQAGHIGMIEEVVCLKEELRLHVLPKSGDGARVAKIYLVDRRPSHRIAANK